MVLSTQCDHSFRIVMWLDANWGIKMMILKIGITASFYRTSEPNFSTKYFFYIFRYRFSFCHSELHHSYDVNHIV